MPYLIRKCWLSIAPVYFNVLCRILLTCPPKSQRKNIVTATASRVVVLSVPEYVVACMVNQFWIGQTTLPSLPGDPGHSNMICRLYEFPLLYICNCWNSSKPCQWFTVYFIIKLTISHLNSTYTKWVMNTTASSVYITLHSERVVWHVLLGSKNY